MHWYFAPIGDTMSDYRLVYDVVTREFEASRLIDFQTRRPRGIAAHVDELVALLPPEELAKAVAASITRS